MKLEVKGKQYINTGHGPGYQIIDIDHPDFVCLIDPDSAFWALVPRAELAEVFTDRELLANYLNRKELFMKEMHTLRFGLKPSAVYFNPTERCNFNCPYCYIPQDIRKNGENMSLARMLQSMEILEQYFDKTIDDGRKPQIIFHGSEPLLNKDVVFRAIEKYNKKFIFGLQTNASRLTEADLDFLKSHHIAIGLSLDGHIAEIADKTRYTWANEGVFEHTLKVIKSLKGYKGFSVICTLTNENIEYARDIIGFFHENHVETCLLNVLRCTQAYSRKYKPDETLAAEYFISALDHSYDLYKKTGRKLVVANFANILLSIVAPTARRLMCDISPCGGGRCFFALDAKGNLFPCSEFIGLEEFNSGNIFTKDIETLLKNDPVKRVTSRMVENIAPCKNCAIRHFCGSPCPAEAFSMRGDRDQPGAFCHFYEKQVRYALRLIADKKEDDFLYDNWDEDTEESFDWSMLK